MKTVSISPPLALIVTVALGASAPCRGNDGDYLAAVRAFADAMIEHGRDTHGKLHSPLFAVCLDRSTLKLFSDTGKVPDMEGIRARDRVLDGANPSLDADFVQTLYALSEITGQPHYAQEADDAMRWFFTHCQSAKGFLAWGYHMGWSFVTEAPVVNEPNGILRHEPMPWPFWTRIVDLAPQSLPRYAHALWHHQIPDQENPGGFDRHAFRPFQPRRHVSVGATGAPRVGGFMIDAWAEAYALTKDPEWLTAIERLVAAFEARRHPETGLLPVGEHPKKLDTAFPPQSLSLAIDLWNAAERVPADLAAKMRQCAGHCDEEFLGLSHDPVGLGFVRAISASTLKPGDPRPEQSADLTHSPRWAVAYGQSITARHGVVCAVRFSQIKDERYRKLAIHAADDYLDSDPDLEQVVFYPEAAAEAISVQLAAHRLTGERRYLDRADHFAALGLRVFFDNDSPLPRAGSRYDHYEAKTGSPTLAMTLLELWATHQSPPRKLKFKWTQR